MPKKQLIIPSCPPVHIGRSLGTWPLSKSYQPVCARILTYPVEAILAIYFLSATGHLPDNFPHEQWIEAVKWHGDTKIAAIIHSDAEMAEVFFLLLAAKMRSSCEEGPGQSAPQIAYHDSQLDVTELKQHRTT